MTRRRLLQSIVAGATTAATGRLFAQPDQPAAKHDKLSITGTTHKDLAPLDDLMTDFVRHHQVPGAALAVTRNSHLVYSRGFGLANVDEDRPVKPNSLFRIASISKPLTAVAALQLVEANKFKLHDQVFDILPIKQWLPAKYDERLRQVTVLNLLQHTGGWDRDNSFDPIVRAGQASKLLNHPLPVGPDEITRFTLMLPLDFDPGTRYAYSNVGYLLLGRLIEHFSGLKYEAYVKQHVLKPMGITRMQLGRAWKEDLAKDEVHYYDSNHREVTAVCGSHLGEKVPLVYGGENFEAYEAHGGWIASAAELVKFAAAFDHPDKSRLLHKDTIASMWQRPTGAAGHKPDGTPTDAYYGCGWDVRPIGDRGLANTWHSGLIAGTSTILIRRHDGFNMAAVFNTDHDSEKKVLSEVMDSKIHGAINAVHHWPNRVVPE